MFTYQADIKIGRDRTGRQRVLVQADDWSKARQLLEAQYGVGNVMNVTQVARAPGRD